MFTRFIKCGSNDQPLEHSYLKPLLNSYPALELSQILDIDYLLLSQLPTQDLNKLSPTLLPFCTAEEIEVHRDYITCSRTQTSTGIRVYMMIKTTCSLNHYALLFSPQIKKKLISDPQGRTTQQVWLSFPLPRCISVS